MMLDGLCRADACQWNAEGGPFCRRCGAGYAPAITAALTVRVINLDRSGVRLATFQRTNSHLSAVERFPASDGATLDQQVLVANGLITADLKHPDYYSIGAIGLAMSHLRLWDLAIQYDQPVTVAEDDAIFNSHFERRAGLVLSSIPPDWDIVLWGFNFDLFASFEMIPGASICLAQFQQQRMRGAIASFQAKQPIWPQAFPLTWAFGTLCYSISPKGAREFKSRILPLRPKIISFPEAARAQPGASRFRATGLDNHLNEIYASTRSFVCFPPLVVTKNERSISTVQDSG
jgi:glycosyl transferase family 25